MDIKTKEQSIRDTIKIINKLVKRADKKTIKQKEIAHVLAQFDGTMSEQLLSRRARTGKPFADEEISILERHFKIRLRENPAMISIVNMLHNDFKMCEEDIEFLKLLILSKTDRAFLNICHKGLYGDKKFKNAAIGLLECGNIGQDIIGNTQLLDQSTKGESQRI